MGSREEAVGSVIPVADCPLPTAIATGLARLSFFRVKMRASLLYWDKLS